MEKGVINPGKERGTAPSLPMLLALPPTPLNPADSQHAVPNRLHGGNAALRRKRAAHPVQSDCSMQHLSQQGRGVYIAVNET